MSKKNKTEYGYTMKKLIEKADKREMYIADYMDYLDAKRRGWRRTGKKSS